MPMNSRGFALNLTISLQYTASRCNSLHTVSGSDGNTAGEVTPKTLDDQLWHATKGSEEGLRSTREIQKVGCLVQVAGKRPPLRISIKPYAEQENEYAAANRELSWHRLTFLACVAGIRAAEETGETQRSSLSESDDEGKSRRKFQMMGGEVDGFLGPSSHDLPIAADPGIRLCRVNNV